MSLLSYAKLVKIERRIKLLEDIVEGRVTSPHQVDGLQFRFDASQIRGLSDSDSVETWLDSSFHYRDLMPGGTSRPRYKALAPAVEFWGQQNHMVADVAGLDLSSGFSMLVAMSIVDLDKAQIVVSLTSGPDPAVTVFHSSTHKNFYVNLNSPPSASSPRAVFSDDHITEGQTMLIGALYDGQRLSIWKDGHKMDESQHALQLRTPDAFRISGYEPGTTWFLGTISDALVFEGAMGPDEWGRVNQFLMNKWAIEPLRHLPDDVELAWVGGME